MRLTSRSRPATATAAAPAAGPGGRPLRDLVPLPRRFHRSVHLPRDWQDAKNGGAPGGYVVTEAIRETARQILDELAASGGNNAGGNAGTRAWTLTGPYGAGKSSFLLFLADLLTRERPRHEEARRLRAERLPPEAAPLRPLLLQAEAAPLIPAVAAALAEAPDGFPDESANESADESPTGAAPAPLRRRALALARRADPSGAECAALLAEAASGSPGGLLLVVDELGKYLEYAAETGTEDLFFLQQLAEAAARSERPIAFLGALHSGFSDYLPGPGAAAHRRAEWQKVQGRFHDLPFALPDEQVLDLIAAALGRADRGHTENGTANDAANGASGRPAGDPYAEPAAAVADALPRNGRRPDAADRLPACAPLHPTTALLLWPLFRSKAAQNERSLFTFLTSHEPYGFRAFLERETVAPGARPPFYRLPDLYDYAVEALGSAAFAGADARRFRRIAHALERIPANAPALAADLVKAIGLLTLYGDAAGLRADRKTLEAVFDHCRAAGVRAALRRLTTESIVLFRRHRSAYGLWEGSDLDLDEALERALREPEPAPLPERLAGAAEPRPLVAREHSVRTGTLRWFEPRLAAPETLAEEIAKPTEADGLLVFLLGEAKPPTIAETIRKALADPAPQPSPSAAAGDAPPAKPGLFGASPTSRSPTHSAPKPILVAAGALPATGRGASPGTAGTLGEKLGEVEAWRRVRENTPELAGDETARREAAAREDAARQRFEQTAGPALGLPGSVLDPSRWRWFRNGVEEPGIRTPRDLQQLLSRLCAEAYPKAPPLHNEMLNRSALSSAAAAGRRNLIERLAAPGDSDERLGIRGFPPEFSMFSALVAAGGFRRKRADGSFRLGAPKNEGWKPVWQAISDFVAQAADAPRPLTDLQIRLEAPPFGLRAGPFPVLVALYLRTDGGRVALYEDGLFVPDTGIETLERLVRRPETFALRSLRFRPMEHRVLRALAETLGVEATRADERLIALTRRLVGGATRLLPYARQTRSLSDAARRVRDKLLTARDPRDLVFQDLPAALGRSLSGPKERAAYAEALRRAVDEAAGAYPALLDRLEGALARTLAPGLRGETLRRRLAEEAGQLRNDAAELPLRQFFDAALRTEAGGPEPGATEGAGVESGKGEPGGDDWREVLALPLGEGLPADRWNDDQAERAEARLRLLAHEWNRLRRFADGASPQPAATGGVGSVPTNGSATQPNGNGAANGTGGTNAVLLFDRWRNAMEPARYSPEDCRLALEHLTDHIRAMPVIPETRPR